MPYIINRSFEDNVVYDVFNGDAVSKVLPLKHESEPKVNDLFIANEQQKKRTNHNANSDTDNVVASIVSNNNPYCLNKRDSANIVASVIFCVAKLQEYLISVYWTSLSNKGQLRAVSNNDVCYIDCDNVQRQKVVADDLMAISFTDQVKLQSIQKEDISFVYSGMTLEDVIQRHVSNIVDKLLQKDNINVNEPEKEQLVKNISNVVSQDLLQPQPTDKAFDEIIPKTINQLITVNFIRNVYLELRDCMMKAQPNSFGFFAGQGYSELARGLDAFIERNIPQDQQAQELFMRN